MTDQTDNKKGPRPASGEARPAQLGRPPIVVVMGHVDHGKTTLLDNIRKTTVAAREAGGITQSIGAYEITHKGKRITFIDTPGHEAFSKMRSRGASAADLAILVVAADEGVKPQTKESIEILHKTKTPFVVALTKIDKTGADLEKVKNDLMGNEVLLEGYGGQVSYEPVSAKTGEHVPELLDLVLLAAEYENLTYDPSARTGGFILEARVDRQRGLEATVIVKNGTLRAGDQIATGTAHGRIKILEDFLGKQAKELVPSSPALIIGFEDLPQVGEEFVSGPTLDLDFTVLHGQSVKQRPAAPALAKGEVAKLNIILKATDTGSLEALSAIVKNIASEKPLRIAGESVGDVNDNDVKLAISTQAIIIAFRSRTDKGSRALAEVNKITIITSEIIYELLKAIEEFLVQFEQPATIGELEVLAIFNQTKPEKQVVGGKVASGIFKNKTQIDIVRGDETLGTGRVMNLQQQKKDAAQVTEGNEAGLLVSSPTLIKAGDRLVIRGSR
jgi:translation initiation factor IF-2